MFYFFDAIVNAIIFLISFLDCLEREKERKKVSIFVVMCFDSLLIVFCVSSIGIFFVASMGLIENIAVMVYYKLVTTYFSWIQKLYYFISSHALLLLSQITSFYIVYPLTYFYSYSYLCISLLAPIPELKVIYAVSL